MLFRSEAHENGRIYDSMDRLRSKVSGGCHAVRFPKGQDPATMGPDKLMQMVQESMNNP